MTVELVLLAMVAAFLGLRLYSVLGKRSGHEQEEPLGRSVDPRPVATVAQPAREAAPLPDPSAERADLVMTTAEPGLRGIVQADRRFELSQFLEGAKAAYAMILEAYWKGDRAQLSYLCDADVAASFVEAIDSREERGERLENRLIRIDKVRIVGADYNAPEGRITLQFDADIAALVRDRDGAMIGGSLSDAVETHDVWTFARDLKSDDPNWRLVETDAA